MEKRTIARRAAALFAYLAGLTFVSAVVVGRSVSTALGEGSTELGRRLDAFHELGGPATAISWNGQTLALSAVVLPHSAETVLERFVGLCHDANHGVAEALASGIGGSTGTASIVQRALVLRDLHEDGTGSAVCFAGLGAGGVAGLVRRARQFTETNDLSALGQLRYAFVRRIGETSTQVTLVMADGRLALDQLLPRDGRDAPGDDLVRGVRPEASTRLLTARAVGTDHALTAYRSALDREAAMSDCGRKMEAAGFTRMVRSAPLDEAQASASGTERVLTEAYRRDDLTYVLTSQRDRGVGSLVSLVQLASGRGATD